MFGSLKSRPRAPTACRKPCAAKNKSSLKRNIPFQAAFTHPMQPENAVADTFQAALIPFANHKSCPLSNARAAPVSGSINANRFASSFNGLL